MQYLIKPFRPQDLVLIALFTAIAFFISFFAEFFKLLPGGGELLLTAFFFPIIVVLLVFIIRKLGTVTFAAFVLVTLALPTPIFTLPGPMKYVVILPPALMSDVIFYLLGRFERVSIICAGAAMNLAVNVLFLYLFILLGLPGVEVVLEFFYFYIAYSMIVGVVGAFVGYRIFKRIEHIPILRTFQTSRTSS